MATHADAIELHGHRGARGLLPENSIVGFREAIRLGVDCIETDIGMSRDGQLVIHHDRALNPSIARRGADWIVTPVPIHELTAAELAAFDVGRLRPASSYASRYPRQKPVDGTRIPLLRELLAMPDIKANARTCLNIEIKTSPLAPNETASPERIVDALVRLLDAHQFRSRVRIQSFDWRNLVHLRKIAPDIALSFLTAERSWLDNLQRGQPGRSPWLAGAAPAEFGGSVPRMIAHMGGRYWAPYYQDITAADVTAARGAGLRVIVWTVNEADDMRRVLALGVDGIITDYPDVGRKVVDRFRQGH